MAIHQPVMPEEVVELLDASQGGQFVDATLGTGGHSERILQASDSGRVIGIDRDPEALRQAVARLQRFGARFSAIHSDYRRISEVIAEAGLGQVNGIVADLGVSSLQFDTPERGFSFRFPDEPLDMRMDPTDKVTAADLLKDLSERELANLIFEFGEERAARRIAREIVRERARNQITRTGQLADVVVRAVHQKGHWRIHPATRTFQALRIAVNRELEDLDGFVARSIDLLATDGRLAVITFHSLEDRIIKRAFRLHSGRCVCPPAQPACSCGAQKRVELLTRKAIQASNEEVALNPRARSAKLRACRKLPADQAA
jgi:16S rRNA (cytosine1402-N4)-methyltransferase